MQFIEGLVRLSSSPAMPQPLSVSVLSGDHDIPDGVVVTLDTATVTTAMDVNPGVSLSIVVVV